MKILIAVDDSQARHLLNEILMVKVDKSIVVIDDDNKHNLQEIVEILSDKSETPRSLWTR